MPVKDAVAQDENVAFQEHDLKGYKLEQQDRPWLVGVLFVSILALSFVVINGWDEGKQGRDFFVPLFFMPDTANTAIDVLTSLAVIATLMERAVEVFIGSTREIKRKLSSRHHKALTTLITQKKADINNLEDESAKKALNAEIERLTERADHVDQRLTSYRTGTRIRALSFSLMFGLLIALAGVRVISPLLDVPYASLSNIQWAALQIVDIAGTAGLIAGGTSGIHSLIRNIGARTEPENASALDIATRPN